MIHTEILYQIIQQLQILIHLDIEVIILIKKQIYIIVYQDNHPEIGLSHDHKWDWSGGNPKRGNAENPNKISKYGMLDNETTIVVVSMSCLAIFIGGFGGDFNNLMFAKEDSLFCWW